MLQKLTTDSKCPILTPATPNDLCCEQKSVVFSRRVEPDSNFAARHQRTLDGQLRPKHRHIQNAQCDIAADAVLVSDAYRFGGPIRLPARSNAAIAS